MMRVSIRATTDRGGPTHDSPRMRSAGDATSENMGKSVMAVLLYIAIRGMIRGTRTDIGALAKSKYYPSDHNRFVSPSPNRRRILSERGERFHRLAGESAYRPAGRPGVGNRKLLME